MKNYLDKGYRLFIDYFYTSVQLVYDMLQRATYVCGALRSNRVNFPPQLTEKVGAGEAKFWNCDNLVVTHWKDKRDVFAMSSMHGNDSVEITNKRGNKTFSCFLRKYIAIKTLIISVQLMQFI